jgi:hypothetical protein
MGGTLGTGEVECAKSARNPRAFLDLDPLGEMLAGSGVDRSLLSSDHETSRKEMW